MKIASIGLGYAGLPLALELASSGVEVVGLDVDERKVEALNKGDSYISHISSEMLRDVVEKKQFIASTDFSYISEVSAVLICVPTPLNKNREPDLSFVLDTGRRIAQHMQRGILVVLESTTYPGTTENELKEVLEEVSGLEAGVDFHLAFAPEREDPGNPSSKTKSVPKVIGGLTKQCAEKAKELFTKAVDEVVIVENCRTAEATKLMENIFRAVNIALVNELKMIYNEMDIDIWDVVAAAKTKPYGYMPFYPSPGMGGHCIPIDPFYLTWKAREYGQNTRFIELAGVVNTEMPNYVVSRVYDALNTEGKAIKGSRILLLGVAYKGGISDDRESPTYPVMEKLESKGAEVFYHDPYVPVIRETREYGHLAGRQSVEYSFDYDLILIMTPHQEYREIDFSDCTIPVVDTRNVVTTKGSKYYKA